MRIFSYSFLVIFALFISPLYVVSANNLKVLIGAYYYDGWSGTNSSNDDWAIGAPRMLTKKMKIEFSEREPIWGWRDDDIAVMEKQIDLASKNGIDFFAFCWYWSDDMGSLNESAVFTNPRHTSLQLFMKAKNKDKMKFCIMIANHNGAEIHGEQNWKKAISFFSENYFNDSQYLRLENKPVVIYYMPQKSQSFLFEMQKEARYNGYDGLYTMTCGVNLSGYDALTWYNSFEGSDKSEAHEYSKLFSYIENNWSLIPDSVVVNPLCSVGWDRRPWESKENTVYYIKKKPELFREHLKKAVDFVLRTDNPHPIIMIYAWNELGEGGYLVPTKGDPKGKYLKQVKNAKRYSIKILKQKSRLKRNASN